MKTFQTILLKIKTRFDRHLHNIIVLGFAFHFIFVAFATTQSLSVSALKTSVFHTNSTQAQNILIQNIGYYALLFLYAFFTVSNVIAPSVIRLIGSKTSLFIAAITYVVFVTAYIYPLVYTLYITAVLIGIGAALLWTAQGQILLDNSDERTIDRNSGIFLAFLTSNFVIGNLFVFLYLGDSVDITAFDRYIIFSVLSFIGMIGVLLILLILPNKQTDSG